MEEISNSFTMKQVVDPHNIVKPVIINVIKLHVRPSKQWNACNTGIPYLSFVVYVK